MGCAAPGWGGSRGNRVSGCPGQEGGGVGKKRGVARPISGRAMQALRSCGAVWVAAPAAMRMKGNERGVWLLPRLLESRGSGMDHGRGGRRRGQGMGCVSRMKGQCRRLSEMRGLYVWMDCSAARAGLLGSSCWSLQHVLEG